MTKYEKEVYQRGFERGYEFGANVQYGEFDEIEVEDMDKEELKDWLMEQAFDAEQNDRDFTPFEFTCKEFNDTKHPEEIWELYDEGITAGLQKGVNEVLEEIQAYLKSCKD